MKIRKVIPPRMRLLSCLILLCAAGHAAAAQPEGIKPPRPYAPASYGAETVSWKNGSFVNLCNTFDGKCQAVKMPKTLGKVERVVEGPFVASARASWLAFSKFETFVCAALRSATTVVCARIQSGAFPLASVDVNIAITQENKSRITVVGKKHGIEQRKLAKFGAEFGKSVWQSALILQGEVDAVAAGMSSFSSSMAICDKDPRHPGPAPHPDCTLVEEGGQYMWSCPIVGEQPPEPEPDPWPDPEPTDPDPCY